MVTDKLLENPNDRLSWIQSVIRKPAIGFRLAVLFSTRIEVRHDCAVNGNREISKGQMRVEIFTLWDWFKGWHRRNIARYGFGETADKFVVNIDPHEPNTDKIDRQREKNNEFKKFLDQQGIPYHAFSDGSGVAVDIGILDKQQLQALSDWYQQQKIQGIPRCKIGWDE